MTSWVCQWKLFWIPVGDTLQKAYLEEWQRVDDGSTCDLGEYSTRAVPCVADSRRQQRAENSDCMPLMYEQPLVAPSAHRDPHGKQLGNLMRLHGNSPEPRALRKSEALLPLRKSVRNFVHPKQLSPFPERLELRFQTERSFEAPKTFLSYVTFYLVCDILERHMVDVRKAFAEFREASVRRKEASPQEYFFDSSVPNHSSVRKSLSVYNWNPGPRRGKECAVETNCRKMAHYHLAGGD